MIWKKHAEPAILSVLCKVSLLGYKNHHFSNLWLQATQYIFNKIYDCLDLRMKLAKTNRFGANGDGSIPKRAILFENWYASKEEDFVELLLLRNNISMQ